MPSPRKIFINGHPIFVTSRMEEGLPLVPTEFMNTLLLGILARAQRLFPIQLSAFLFQRNHFHMILTVIDPEHVSPFIGYVKQEITHAVNRLLGRRKKTLWCEGFDSPTILDFETLLNYLIYIYTQPVRDQLAPSIDRYSGISSWDMFSKNIRAKNCLLLGRGKTPRLSNPHAAWKENEAVMAHLRECSLGEIQLVLKPFAWKKCFPESRSSDESELHALICERVRKAELDLFSQLPSSKFIVQDVDFLSRRSMLEAYVPKAFGKRMICLAARKETRIAFITWVREIVALAGQVYKLWKLGLTEIQYPPGLFAPNLPRKQNFLYSSFVT